MKLPFPGAILGQCRKISCRKFIDIGYQVRGKTLENSLFFWQIHLFGSGIFDGKVSLP